MLGLSKTGFWRALLSSVFPANLVSTRAPQPIEADGGLRDKAEDLPEQGATRRLPAAAGPFASGRRRLPVGSALYRMRHRDRAAVPAKAVQELRALRKKVAD